MKKFTIAGALVCGILIGMVLYDRIISTSFSSYRQVIFSSLLAEEELMAAREERKGNQLAALFHRWNAVRFTDPEQVRAFSKERNHEIDNDLFAPLALLMLNEISNASDPDKRGMRMIEAYQRGHLAYQLEHLGFSKLASKEWETAASLSKHSISQMKLTISKLRENFDD